MLATEHSYDTVNDNRNIEHNIERNYIIERASIRVNTHTNRSTYDVIDSRVHLAIRSSEQDSYNNDFYCFINRDREKEKEEIEVSKELCKICELVSNTYVRKCYY